MERETEMINAQRAKTLTFRKSFTAEMTVEFPLLSNQYLEVNLIKWMFFLGGVFIYLFIYFQPDMCLYKHIDSIYHTED